MAQPSPTRIVNMALVLLGTAQRIASLDEPTPLADAARAVFDECRDAVLAEHPWNFALRRKVVPRSADVDGDAEWAYAHELPSDCLRWLPWSSDHVNHFGGEREGRFLRTNEEGSLTIRYIAREEDAARWSPGFAIALAGRLAMWLAPAAPVSSDMSSRRANALYEQELSRGRRMDGLESGNTDREAPSRSNWLASRGGQGDGFLP